MTNFPAKKPHFDHVATDGRGISKLQFPERTACMPMIFKVSRDGGRDYPCQSPRLYDLRNGPSAPLPGRGTLHEGDRAVSQLSVFVKEWTPVSAEWNDPRAEQDMASLLRMRSVVLSLLEQARGEKHLKSSLEAEVDIIFPNDISYLHAETFLKTLFIVSDANITDEGSLRTSSFAWSYVSSMDIPDSDLELAIRIRPASLDKCPCAAGKDQTYSVVALSKSSKGCCQLIVLCYQPPHQLWSVLWQYHGVEWWEGFH
ncbi:hypothetical protein EV424DRAFT_1352682 [Suillus variegatus]|nr:hypothetical protein EV424DRAFT_1352682 [Suillus variegatus]